VYDWREGALYTIRERERGAGYMIIGGCSLHDQRRVQYTCSEEGAVYMIRGV
jgi:hypothetical protein